MYPILSDILSTPVPVAAAADRLAPSDPSALFPHWHPTGSDAAAALIAAWAALHAALREVLLPALRCVLQPVPAGAGSGPAPQAAVDAETATDPLQTMTMYHLAGEVCLW